MFPTVKALRVGSAPAPARATRGVAARGGTGTADPTGQTQADPDIRQEIARLKAAIPTGNRSLLSAWGGFNPAADRLMALRQLPEGRPTKTTARGAIDRFKCWSTVRLTTPEAAT